MPRRHRRWTFRRPCRTIRRPPISHRRLVRVRDPAPSCRSRIIPCRPKLLPITAPRRLRRRRSNPEPRRRRPRRRRRSRRARRITPVFPERSRATGRPGPSPSSIRKALSAVSSICAIRRSRPRASTGRTSRSAPLPGPPMPARSSASQSTTMPIRISSSPPPRFSACTWSREPSNG